MKDITNYIQENLLTGKKVLEKFQITKDSVLIKKENPFDFKLTKTIGKPVADNDDKLLPVNKWKKIKIPSEKYVVYRDLYRVNKWHLATTYDMLINMGYNSMDFEDFNPKNDILLASDDIQDIIEAYIKMIFEKYNYDSVSNLDMALDLLKDENAADKFDKWIEKCCGKHYLLKIHDNFIALHHIYHGEDLYGESNFTDKDIYDEISISF